MPGHKAPAVARAYVNHLRDLIGGLGVSDVRMDQGSLRCDVNLSLRPTGREAFGTRTETKNVNSFKSVEQAARFEIQRQAALLDAGEKIIQETRHFHEKDGSTSPGREKSDADDYRYFPEPDLAPIAASREWVDQLRRRCRNPRPRAAVGCRPSGSSATSTCATPSARARSTSSQRRSRPVPPRSRPASGGSVSLLGARTRPRWN